MTEQTNQLAVQATRSFNEYVQGETYVIDANDEKVMTLLGAGYFSEDHNPALQLSSYTDSDDIFPGNPDRMAEQEHVNVEAGYQPANDVQVPEKMTGSKRATTADEGQVNGSTVGTEPTGDSSDGSSRRAATRKSGGSRNN